jgi:hypothetical protein
MGAPSIGGQLTWKHPVTWMPSTQHLGKTCGSHIFIFQLMLRSIRDQDGCHRAC